MAACAGCGRELTGTAVTPADPGWREATDDEQTAGLGWHPSCAMADDPAEGALVRGYVTVAPGG